MRTSRYVLRTWDRDSLEGVMAFYEANASEASPPPSVAALDKALDQGRLLVIEPEGGGGPVAASAILDFSPSHYRTYVGELSGTCVTRPLNGCRPLSGQRLLLGFRLLAHATYAAEPTDGFTNTLICIVKEDNLSSRRHVEAAGLVPLRQLPGWMAYEHRSWSGANGGGWTYFMATADTVRQAARDLIGLGLLSGPMRFRRDDRDNGGEEAIEIRCEVDDMAIVETVVRAIAADEHEIQLCAPPERLP